MTYDRWSAGPIAMVNVQPMRGISGLIRPPTHMIIVAYNAEYELFQKQIYYFAHGFLSV